MAMTTCRECKSQISTTADACPKCGAKPKKTSGCAVVVAIFLGLFAFSVIARSCAGESSTAPQSAKSNSVASPAPNTPSPKADPAAVLAESTKTVDEVEARLKENATRLKKFYGTADQVKTATADLIKLALVEGLYQESKIKAEKQLSVRADSLIGRVSMQQRSLYASTMEEAFIKNGMDIRVSATGAKKDQLRLRYILMSQPLVYKFQNEMKLGEQAGNFGFKKVILTDGYDETWTLEP
jgi:hypothetical protein